MPNITREQFSKWNSKATNGFSFDVKEYVVWGNKSLIRDEKLDDGKIAEFRIGYSDEYVTKTNDWGCKWNVKTGKKIPHLDINILHPSSTDGIYRVQSYKRGIVLGDTESKSNYGVLCKLAESVNVDDYLKEML